MVVEASEKNKVVWCYGKKIQLEPRIPGRSIAVPRIAYYNYYLLVEQSGTVLWKEDPT